MKTHKTGGAAAPQDTNIADIKRQSAAAASPVDKTYPGGLTPDAGFPKPNEALPRPAVYSQTWNQHIDPYFIERQKQNDFLADAIKFGAFICNPQFLVEENNRQFPAFPLYLGESFFDPVLYHMSRMLADIDDPDNVIWAKGGHAAGYRLPGSKGCFLDAKNPSFLNHFQFLTVPAAFAREGSAQPGIDISRWYRILSHRWVRFIVPNEAGDGWLPGPANRRKGADGEVDGSVDYVIANSEGGELFLTPHGLLVIHACLPNWAQMIF